MGKEEEKTVIKLQHPVQWGDDLIDQVEVRRPKGKDLKGLKNISSSMDDQLKLLARLIGQTDGFVGELDLATDLTAIMQVVSDFLPDGP